MKLVSFNIAIFIDNSEEVAKLVDNLNPDILAFQEAVRHFDENVSKEYQSQRFIEAKLKTKLPYSFFGPQWICSVNSKNGEVYRKYGGPIEQGNEIKSKYKIINASNEHYHRSYEISDDRTNFYEEDHARSLQIVELDINGQRVQVLNIHGTYTTDKRDTPRTLKQTKYLLEAAARKKIPTIIVGDFNLLPDTESIRLIGNEYKNLVSEYGIKYTRPNFKDSREEGNNIVDYIFVSDDIEVTNFGVIETDISDHYPLILEFEIKKNIEN